MKYASKILTFILWGIAAFGAIGIVAYTLYQKISNETDPSNWMLFVLILCVESCRHQEKKIDKWVS